MADERPKPAGIGPEAVDGSTYHEIARQQREQEAAQRGLKPGLDAETILTDGAVPRMTTGPWTSGDHFGKEPPLGEAVDSSDPSGVTRNKGVA